MPGQSIIDYIKKPHSRVFRRAYIKRRNIGTGAFESSWVEISKDIKKWGTISTQLDSERLNKFTFGNMRVVVQNDQGKYNPEDSEDSYWYNYMPQQRTLFKIETGFFDFTTTSGVTQVFNIPNGVTTAFVGIFSGDMPGSDKNEITFNVKPLTEVFRNYAASNIRGLDGSMTASRFMELLRDQTDGSGGFVFRPFFDNTTTNFDISTTTTQYLNLNTSTSEELREKNVWEIIEKLSEAENHVSYITRDGKFRFRSRSALTTTAAYLFNGVGGTDNTYGQTIKTINSYGKKPSKFYSRVQIQFNSLNTTTSYSTVQSAMVVESANAAWALGERTFSISNTLIPNVTVAEALAQNIFNDVSTIKNEIEFTTTFVPHLEILDRVQITYDSSPVLFRSLWDLNDWADATNSSDLYWDASGGNALKLNAKEFKFISQNIDLDRFECKFIAREV